MTPDPMEAIIAHALDRAAIPYDRHPPHRLDFDLPTLGIAIEVKRMHSDRISEQMSRVNNVIAVQGSVAVEFLGRAIQALGDYDNASAGETGR